MYYNRDRRSATDNDDYADRAMLKPNIPSVAGTHPTMSLLSSEFHKVSPRHVVSFMFAVLISIYTVVLSFGPVAYSASRRAQVMSMTTPTSFLASILAIWFSTEPGSFAFISVGILYDSGRG